MIDILVPYLKTGLQNNESCICVTSEPLSEEKTRQAIGKAVPDSTRYLEAGQIEIIPYNKWYLKDGVFDGQRVLNAWIEKFNQALAEGYDGMRVMGNLSWFEEKDWASIIDYEKGVNNVVSRHNMLCLCSYPIANCDTSKVLDVVLNHQRVLIKRAGNWVLVENVKDKWLQHDLDERKRAEEDFENIFNLSPDMMGVFTTEGRLIRLNPSWEIILGYKTEELLKMGWAQLVHPDDVERTNKEVEKQLKGSPVVNFVNRYKCKDDSYKTLEWQATFAKNGIVTATARDITEYKWLQHDLDERKCAEEVLRESEGEYNALHNNMLNGFAHCKMLFDENNQPIDFIYLDVNDAFERLTGLRREDVIDRRVTEAIPGIKESHHELLIIYGKVASTGEATSFDLYFKPLKIWLTISVYSTQKGYFIAVFENITKRKQAEERIKTLRPTPEKLIPLEDRFQKYGLKDFSGPEKIRLLLCHNLPRKEGEKLVNEVTKRYKTLRELLTAPDRELGQIPGITPRTLLCIKLMKEMPKAFLREKIINKHVHKSSRDIFDYLYYSMRSITNEILKVLYLDSQNKIIAIEDMFKGTLDSIHIYPREIEAGAIGHNATGLVFVHNHPSGDPAPSKNDRKITRDLVFIGQVLQIKVVDHIIIGGDNYFSFADVGLITKYEDEFLNLRIRSLALRK